jgi:ABC-type sugar transport system ATPase subunit
MRGIVKEFPGVRALNSMSFDVFEGEVHCLVGENGAGKSTLMKILSGAHAPTSGSILIDGREYKALTPALSSRLGIEIVYQENDLVPTMNAVENIFVGKEPPALASCPTFRACCARCAVDGPVPHRHRPAGNHRKHVRFQPAVCQDLKALMNRSRILIMDEPTSMFNVEDAGKVLDLVGAMSRRGISIIYISHFLKEVVRIADRITVIRDGSVIRTYANAARDCSLDDITSDMVGRPVDMFYQRERCPIGEAMIEVRDLK